MKWSRGVRLVLIGICVLLGGLIGGALAGPANAIDGLLAGAAIGIMIAIFWTSR
ncbi:hypothetical protein KNO81_39500 [Paraburkholderia sediminicola]|jgi:hypothetical protein|nr:hypothetical protein [Paraburkholderia sediminicola]